MKIQQAALQYATDFLLLRNENRAMSYRQQGDPWYNTAALEQLLLVR